VHYVNRILSSFFRKSVSPKRALDVSKKGSIFWSI